MIKKKPDELKGTRKGASERGSERTREREREEAVERQTFTDDPSKIDSHLSTRVIKYAGDARESRRREQRQRLFQSGKTTGKREKERHRRRSDLRQATFTAKSTYDGLNDSGRG